MKIWKNWKIIFFSKSVFSFKTEGIGRFCVFFLIEEPELVCAISRKKSRSRFLFFSGQKYVFLVHFGIFSNGSSSAFLFKHDFKIRLEKWISKTKLERKSPFPRQEKKKYRSKVPVRKKELVASICNTCEGMCENAWNQLFFAYRYFTPVFFIFLAREWVFPF